ncbi:TRADD-N-associated membrane domain-containing protein [Streptomyces cinereoruber]|uniref:TRADD-N-associated membrane domain-containing protein n=1 Tax=Streptomyces cinereoruber TaxID=67260 RepID=UPI00363E43F3
MNTTVDSQDMVITSMEGCPAMDRRQTVLRKVLLVLLLLVVVTGVFLVFFLLKITDGLDGPGGTVFASLAVGALVLTSTVTRAMLGDAHERNTVEASRARLDDAERALEVAVAQWDEVTHGGAGRAAGGTVVVPAPSGNNTESPQSNEDHAAAESAHLALPALWGATHARLTHYHNLALQHAKRSFKSAQAAMWAGFGALGVFVWIAFEASTTAGAVVAGGLGAVAATLSGFIAKTFIRSQEASADHLRSYFDQPLELSRYLAAERLMASADLTSEQRAEVITALVTAMVAGPQPPQDQQQPEPAPVPQQPTGRR